LEASVSEVVFGLLGVVVGAAASAVFGFLRDRADRAASHRRDVSTARREVYLVANRAVVRVVEASQDFLDSWYGHQPSAPQHDYAALLRDASRELVNLSIMGSREVSSSSAVLRQAVKDALNIEFWEAPEDHRASIEAFHVQAGSLLAEWQDTLRADLGIDVK
jgi:hypothetical protein